MRPPREDTQPWYKQFWPWFLISLPLAVVIASFVTLNMAIESDDGLVSDDYYKEGLAIRKNADSSAKARALGIAAGLEYDADTGAMTLRFDRAIPVDSGMLSLQATHPTRPDHDQLIPLTPVGDAAYVGRLDPLGPANWRLEVHPADKSWRIEGRLALPESDRVRLN